MKNFTLLVVGIIFSSLSTFAMEHDYTYHHQDYLELNELIDHEKSLLLINKKEYFAAWDIAKKYPKSDRNFEEIIIKLLNAFIEKGNLPQAESILKERLIGKSKNGDSVYIDNLLKIALEVASRNNKSVESMFPKPIVNTINFEQINILKERLRKVQEEMVAINDYVEQLEKQLQK